VSLTGPDVALLVLRFVLGAVYLVHGARKLGWIGSGGFADFIGAIARRGYRPPALWAAAAVGAEVAGGALAVGGLLTPVAGALLVAQSTVITLLVAPRGFWHSNEGIEYPLLLAVAAAAIGLVGPGAISLDVAFGIRVPAGLPELLVSAGVAAGVIAFLAHGRPATRTSRDGARPGGPPPPR
jgi:putative oxidoreductase